MNLAVRDIRHKLGRFVLTCLGLALLLGVVLSMVGIYRGLVDDALVLARSPGVQLWVVQSDTRGPFAEASRIPGEARDAIARLYGVRAAGAVTYQTVETRHDGRKIRLYVVGYEPGRPGGPAQIMAGRGIARAHYELVADRRSGLELGDRLRLGDEDFTVVGLTDNQVDSGGNPVAYVSLKDAQELQFGLEPAVARKLAARGELPTTNTINAVVAKISPHVSVDAVAAAAERWKHLSALTQAEQEALLLESVVEKARRQIGLFTSILLVVSAVIIALIIYTMTMDKTREIATLKLIGAPDRRIAGLILQQALAMGLIGFVLGAVLIASAAGYFPRRVILQPGDGLAWGAWSRWSASWPACSGCVLPSGSIRRRRSEGDAMTAMLAPARSLVELRNVSKHFGSGPTRVDALRKVTLDIYPGEVVGLLGPSGSGKSTLLNVIGAITEPSAGRICLDGEVVYENRWLRGDLRRLRLEKIGFIFQFHNLIPFLTCLENVLVVLDLAGWEREPARGRAMELLDYLGVADRRDMYPASLSGGQAQRVAIARALANRPHIILGDEPTASLDSRRAGQVMDLLRQLAVEQDAAIIVVTHDEKIFDRFDRIFHLRDGRLESVEEQTHVIGRDIPMPAGADALIP